MNEKENTKKLPTWREFQSMLIVKAMKDRSFHQELLANPKAVIEREMGKLKEGAKLPATMEVKVIEQPANVLYLVLPAAQASELSHEALSAVTGGFINQSNDRNNSDIIIFQ